MRMIRPYRTVQGARRTLDNGGRFYNLRARAGDDVVDAGELAKAAGVRSDRAGAFLYLDMALMDLPVEQKNEVLSLLSPDLNRQFAKKQAQILKPSAVESSGKSGTTAIVSGYPAFVEDKTRFAGFIVMVTPIIMMIPIMDRFDVYEVFDTPELTGRRTVIATVRGSKRLARGFVRFGGFLKELSFDDKTGKDHGLYMETLYYTPLT